MIKADIHEQNIQAYYSVKVSEIGYHYTTEEDSIANLESAIKLINNLLKDSIKTK